MISSIQFSASYPTTTPVARRIPANSVFRDTRIHPRVFEVLPSLAHQPSDPFYEDTLPQRRRGWEIIGRYEPTFPSGRDAKPNTVHLKRLSNQAADSNSREFFERTVEFDSNGRITKAIMYPATLGPRVSERFQPSITLTGDQISPELTRTLNRDIARMVVGRYGDSPKLVFQIESQHKSDSRLSSRKPPYHYSSFLAQQLRDLKRSRLTEETLEESQRETLAGLRGASAIEMANASRQLGPKGDQLEPKEDPFRLPRGHDANGHDAKGKDARRAYRLQYPVHEAPITHPANKKDTSESRARIQARNRKTLFEGALFLPPRSSKG